jgi:hypothetical protein
MPLIVKDRVQETSTTTGTGTFTLSGANSGFATFSSAIGNGNTTYYAIVGGTEWEVGIGTVGAGTLARTTLLASSTGSAISFSAGIKNVFCTYPASKSVTIDDIQTLTNKTINLASNTLTGTTAQFNTALSDGDFATLAGTETLTNKTLTSPTITGGALNGTLGATTPSTVVATNVNTPNTFGFKNLLIDAGFTINQRGYVSAATLASGSYGHDRWKAGASGGNYTFTQLASSTTITIASGKSLIQVVEDKNVNGTSFVLSWTGTAQARYAVNSATPSGSYAASPILITGQTVGTTMSVEFNAGTLSNPQLELGSTATSFDVRDYGRELIMCQRYYFQDTRFFSISTQGAATNGQTYPFLTFVLPVSMRTTPTITPSGSTTFSGVSSYNNQTLDAQWGYSGGNTAITLKLDNPATGAFNLPIKVSAEL